VWKRSGNVILANTVGKVGIGLFTPTSTLSINNSLAVWGGTSDVFSVNALGNATTSGRLVVGSTNPTTNDNLYVNGTAYLTGNATTTGHLAATGGNSDQWNTAYSWGNHATAGYFLSANFASSWASAYNATTTLNGFTPANYLLTSNFGTQFNSALNSTTTLDLTTLQVNNLTATAATSTRLVVGSGNPTADYPLWVNGTIGATNGVVISGGSLQLNSGYLYHASTDFTLNSYNGSSIFESLRVKAATGKVGIGLSTPTSTLSVANSLAVWGGTSDVFKVDNLGNATTTGSLKVNE
jgi:hypothetical protein